MHAIVRQGDGKYYISPVFGFYKDIKSTDDYERYLECIHSPYYVVWNEERTCLIKWYAMQPNTKYLIPQILIIDCSQDNWVKNDEGVGGVDFLPRQLADEIINKQIIPNDIMEKCRNLDAGYVFVEDPEVKNKHDAENLEWVSGGFHDAYIESCEMKDDGTLYVKFDGTWGCKIELWLWGDVEYCIESRNPEIFDPYWFGSTIILEDGFIYLVDDEGMSVDKITDGYCWFKARHMKYHIIPD